MKKEFLGALRGYYYDTDTGMVYSTKTRSKKPVPLKWQQTATKRYLYLSDRFGKRFRVEYDNLYSESFARRWFSNGVNGVEAAVHSNAPCKPAEPTVNNKFVVGIVSGLQVTFSKVYHDTEDEARIDAGSQAIALPDRTFFVAAVRGVVRAQKLVWE